MRLFPFFLLSLLGLAAGALLAPFEAAAVREHLIGFPGADPRLHGLRPWAVCGLCLVPALGALWYAFASILDRYLFRKTLSAFLIATSALLLLFILMDFQDSMSDILSVFAPGEEESGEAISAAAAHPWRFLGAYYTVLLSQTIVLLLPFTILLGLLFSLGQLSSSREIIAFTQTGRGIFRLLRPLVILGSLLSLLSFFLNFHLAPWAEGYREALLESAQQGTASQANNVMHHNPDDHRLWFIGRFPYDQTLLEVEIGSMTADGVLIDRLKATKATWNRETGDWSFSNPRRILARTEPTPIYEKGLPDPLIISDWSETPSQLIQRGLDARYLGIPGLQDWLRLNPDRANFLTRSFETQLHYRWAKPWLCLVSVLLAAPLGISFSRRGRGGTVTVAIILSGVMLFSAEIFLAFGDSGQIPSIPAAWATNAIFTLLALILIQRRLVGRPIFQTIRKCFGQ